MYSDCIIRETHHIFATISVLCCAEHHIDGIILALVARFPTNRHLGKGRLARFPHRDLMIRHLNITSKSHYCSWSFTQSPWTGDSEKLQNKIIEN